MRPRQFALPLAAVVITGLCAYRATRPPRPVAVAVDTEPRALPPRGWELPDQDFRLVKFDRFLGRHATVVLFCDDALPLDSNPQLSWLHRHAEEIYDAGWRIVAIHTAPPAEARRAAAALGAPWPFPVLTDMHLRDPAPLPVHHLWSRVDRATGRPLPALFLVDRLGYIAYRDGRPRPEAEPLAALEALIHQPSN